MADVTQRMNYFDRQFLRAKDFQDEQAYHVDRRRRHNAGFHSEGVVQGLQVVPSGTANQVNVEPGWAVDLLGREIVLGAPRTNVPTGGVAVEIWISYPDPEPLAAPANEGGATGSTRVDEAPVVTVVPPGTVPPNALRLATVSGAGAINNDVRLRAGLKNQAVSGPNLADNAVSSRVLAEADAAPGQDPNSGTGVKTAHLKDRAVSEPKLADLAVSARTLQANTVGQNQLQNNAVQSRALAPADPGTDQTLTTGAGVKTGHLKDGAVTAAKLADNAVSSAKLQSHPSDNAQRPVAKEHLRDGSVSIAKLSAKLVFDAQVSVPPPPSPGGSLVVLFDQVDTLAFYLISVHYVGPRPVGPEQLLTSLGWIHRNSLFRPATQGVFFHRHELVILNPNTTAITVACRVYRVDEV